MHTYVKTTALRKIVALLLALCMALALVPGMEMRVEAAAVGVPITVTDGAATVSSGTNNTLDIGTLTQATTITVSNSGTVLTVTGTKTGVNYGITFDIDTGARVDWSAAFISSAEYAVTISGTGTFSMTGGSIESTYSYGKGIYSTATAPGTVTVSGGTVLGRNYGIYNISTGSVTVSGGTVTGNTYGIYNGYDSNTTGTVTVSGGTVEGNSYGIYNRSKGSVTVSGTGTVMSMGTGGGTGIYNYYTGAVTVNGGTINSSYYGIYNRTSSSVNVSGGTVTGRQYGIYNESTYAVTVKGTATVISGGTLKYGTVNFTQNASNKPVGFTYATASTRTRGTSTDIDVTTPSTGATVVWDIDDGDSGISWSYGTNTGFYEVSGVTVLPDPISAAAITGITAPTRGATPDDDGADGTGFTTAIAWQTADGTAHTGAFAAVTVYKAQVTLTAASGYIFPSSFSNTSAISGFTVNSIAPVWVSRSDSALVFTVEFDETGRYPGSTISTLPAASSKSTTAITVSAATLTTATGQTIHYAINQSGTVAPTADWGTSTTFTGLTSNTTYYVWAKAQESTDYAAGTPSPSLAITTDKTGASLSPTTATYDKNGGTAVAITLTPGDHTLSAIKNGAAALTPDTEYSVSSHVYTIQTSYLDTLAIGEHALTFDMNDGTDPTVTITVSDTSPTVTTVSVTPATSTVVKGGTQQFAATITGTYSPATTVTWSVSPTTGGSSIDASGLLTIAAGETASALTVMATSTVDTSKSGTATVTVMDATIAPTITTNSLSDGTVGTAYSATLAANGTTPITWSVTTGNLPDGLSLDSSTGIISGTPTVANTFAFTVQAANGTLPPDTQELSITITPAPASPTYAVTVTNGTGGGSYAPGAAVSIFANTPAEGYQFSHWTATPAVTFADVYASSTTFPMIAQPVTITAMYAVIPVDPAVSPSSLTMTAGESGTLHISLGTSYSGADISSSDAAVATVSPASVNANGDVQVNAIAAGNVVITITFTGGTPAYSVTVPVIVAATALPPVDPADPVVPANPVDPVDPPTPITPSTPDTGDSASGGGSGGDSTGSNPTGGSSRTQTIPADENTVRVDYTQKGGSVTLQLPDSKIDEIIKNADTEADFNLSGNTTATTITAPTSAIQSVAEAGLLLRIDFPQGSITLSPEAALSLLSAAGGNTLTIRVEEREGPVLNDAQQAAVPQNAPVYDISVWSNNVLIHNFDGTVTVEIPYTGPIPASAWYLDGEGNLTKVAGGSYHAEKQTFRFHPPHLSLYLVDYDGTKASNDNPETGGIATSGNINAAASSTGDSRSRLFLWSLLSIPAIALLFHVAKRKNE